MNSSGSSGYGYSSDMWSVGRCSVCVCVVVVVVVVVIVVVMVLTIIKPLCYHTTTGVLLFILLSGYHPFQMDCDMLTAKRIESGDYR